MSIEQLLDVLALQLMKADPQVLVVWLNHAIKKTRMRPERQDQVSPETVADLGLEHQLASPLPVERRDAIRQLLIRIRDSEANAEALRRFIVRLRPHLDYIEEARTTAKSIFDKIKKENQEDKSLDRSPKYYTPIPLGSALVNREKLRDRLHELFEHPDDEMRLLVIRGNGIGKSHHRHLVIEVVKDIWNTIPLYIPLADFAAMPDSFQALTQSIASLFGLTLPYRNAFLNTPVRNAKEFSYWLGGEVRQLPPHGKHVIMFDDVAKSDTTEAMRGLVILLARQARERQLGNVYFVLLECSESDAAELVQNKVGACEEHIDHIEKNEVSRFIEEWAVKFKACPDLNATPPSSVTHFIERCSYPLDYGPLLQLNKELTRWLKANLPRLQAQMNYQAS